MGIEPALETTYVQYIYDILQIIIIIMPVNPLGFSRLKVIQ